MVREAGAGAPASDCRQRPRLFAEDFSALKRLKVSIFKTFQSLFGIIKVSKKAVCYLVMLCFCGIETRIVIYIKIT